MAWWLHNTEKGHTLGVKNTRDKILIQTIPRYNILGKLHFSKAQSLHLKKSGWNTYLSELLLWFFSSSFVGFPVMTCNPNERVCSINVYSWSVICPLSSHFCMLIPPLTTFLLLHIYWWIPRLSHQEVSPKSKLSHWIYSLGLSHRCFTLNLHNSLPHFLLCFTLKLFLRTTNTFIITLPGKSIQMELYPWQFS